jgi:hypothetical protein
LRDIHVLVRGIGALWGVVLVHVAETIAFHYCCRYFRLMEGRFAFQIRQGFMRLFGFSCGVRNIGWGFQEHDGEES